MAFSATVVPCRNNQVSLSSSSIESSNSIAATVSESRMPSENPGGVENAFATTVTPDSSTTTLSVQVPPTSTPTMKRREDVAGASACLVLADFSWLVVVG
jgi:hypothetical protein